MLLSGCLTGGEVDEPTGSSGSTPGANTPPTIGGNPSPAVTVGNSYTFTPVAADVDGDSLTFSVANLPSWATFDSGSGTLSGNVTLGHIGTWSNIRISVSDGATSTDLPTFSIEVSQLALGSATLSWNPPTQNTDGSPVQLAGYRIYYGTTSGQYTREVYIDNPGLSSYVVADLTPNTYYFASTAVTQQGVESGFSAEAIKTISSN